MNRKEKLSYFKAKYESLKQQHLCTWCRKPLDKDCQYTMCDNCRERNRLKSKIHYTKNKQSKSCELGFNENIITEIDNYNDKHNTNLSYGKYMALKRNGKIT